MAKGMTQKKMTKKKPAKTMKEKRADKIAKKRANAARASADLTEAIPTAPIDVRQQQAAHVDGRAMGWRVSVMITLWQYCLQC